MSAVTCLLCGISLLSAALPVSVSADQQIRSESGQTVVLPGRLTSTNPVLVVEWRRTDLGSDYVLLYRDEQMDPFNQHPSYQNRVGLQDLENGDVSLVLQGGKTDDSGTYECRVVQTGKNRRKQLISTVHLVVAPPPPPARFEKLKGDQKTRPGSEEEGGNQEVLTSDPTAGSEAEVTDCGGSHVGEARAQALQVQLVESQRSGRQDGENRNQNQNQSRTVPGLIVSLSLFSLVVAAFISFYLWKKKQPETQPAVI
ncbi:coxsackievirus and adenovirus receptor-like [Poeciliopsis prolifica]|uniref:coxsackievirus and adenovirus receptor-like n=1 Tax=Poeciliopsis prolifica TaxID=188132 RepID=UPI002414387B|nr:coxsackievirus and adenovirus receptor-like [Poeciliopsis prolifica]